MANRNLTSEELTKANHLLDRLRSDMEDLSGGDAGLLFAYRRKIAKELTYDERGKPLQRKMLKSRKMGEQQGLCAICGQVLPEKYSVLDRLSGMGGYTPENTRLIHQTCDTVVQIERNYA